MAKRWKKAALAALVVGVAVQGVPYGWSVEDPPSGEPLVLDPIGAALFARACNDCHGRGDSRPWWGRIAPMSWALKHDMEEARRHLDAGALRRSDHSVHEAHDVVERGEMPLARYTMIHPEAKLTPAERKALSLSLRAAIRGDKAPPSAVGGAGPDDKVEEGDGDGGKRRRRGGRDRDRDPDRDR